ncbi:MAG TPA: hypothetical protein VNJ28_04960 [Candidatus Limnocylindrales bacterium]|nr:hypothetical protein [Candidatus Limnocylindrales bacterium]
MPVPRGRLDAASSIVAIVLGALVVASVAGPVAPRAAAADPVELERFLAALGEIESGGRYGARNPRSGAYGKYQILPSNWRAWARLYLGNANARPTPKNQERVARAKVSALFAWLDEWDRVAYWWLTGRVRPERHWTGFARRYVGRVMRLFGATTDEPSTGDVTRPARRTVQETAPAIDYGGRWGSARNARYLGGAVRWSEQRGATVAYTFTGRSVVWLGPKGPTRGEALVIVDGVEVGVVDLRAPRFRARERLFVASWPEPGEHTIAIEVLGTRGRPTVAVDAFLVAP